MGAWGAGIFEDDVAADVAGTWQDTAGGPAAATEAVFEEFGEAIEDVDDGPVIFFALASLQLDAGALDKAVKERALASIEPNVRRWEEESSPDDAAERRRVLEDLRQRLESFTSQS